MPESPLEYLFDCYVYKKCSPDEERELMKLLAEPGNEQAVQKLLEKFIKDTGAEIKMPEQAAFSVLQNILQKDKAKAVSIRSKKTILSSWIRVAAAVVVLLFVSGISYWFLNRDDKDNRITASASSQKASAILPGGNHAVLKLADGSIIILDSVQNGKIKGGNFIINKQNGLLVYNVSALSEANAPMTFNTLTTPRGGQYQVVLADGSKVWLNASSSLYFPTSFTGKQRDVELTGEAYFEVAKNTKKPFHVNVSGMQIEVLGTHFNVNAYHDEDDIKTTLLEGSVKIKRGSASGLLGPGQQGILEKNDNNIKIKNANIDEVMAWKNGLFQFDGADIKTIMREIGKWYDVDIVYAGEVPVRSFEGKIKRSAQLSEVLKILELSNVKFNVEGRKIVVQ